MFGEKLKKLRMDKNMTQQELAKILKISSSTIGMYEQNRRSPDIETLKLIADYFQCSTDYLLGKNDIENMNRLSLLRKSHNMSQAELAEKLGVTQQTISKYENGSREPDTETLKLLSSIFNVSIDYLLGATNIRNHDTTYITPKEHEDIEEVVEELRERLLNTENFKIEGEPTTKEDIETILDSVKVGIEMAKIKKRRDRKSVV